MGVTVRQKAKGRGKPWWVFIAHDNRRASKLVGDKVAAEEVASKIRAKIQLGEFSFEGEDSIPTFRKYADGFLDGYSVTNHKSSTHDSYDSALEKHLKPFFGDMPLDAITRKHVKDFIQEKSKKLAPGTVRNLRAYMSAILSQAEDDEIIPANPALRTGRLIKKTDQAGGINPLTWEEKAKLEDTLKEHYPKYYPLFLLALRTGMRIGEIVALQPGDLDFNGGFIEVRRGCSRGKITTPKNGKSRRVDMSKDLAATLKTFLTERKKETLSRGWGEPPEWLFYNEEGGMVDINNVRKRVFYKALERAGLRTIRVHDLRHTYATLRISKGDNILDVSKQLGHHSAKLTLDIYCHWMAGSKKSEVDELDSKTAPGCTLSAPEEPEANKKEVAQSANPLI